MTQNLVDSIRSAVHAHYADPSKKVLLLSELGNILRGAGLWPLATDPQPLARFVEKLAPEIVIVRDPNISAYVAVVPADRTQLATDAIEKRLKTRVLDSLPRPIVLAFCIRVPDGQAVYVQITPPFRYQVGDDPESGFVVVEEQFRSPGLYVDDIHALPMADVSSLVAKIEGWATRHNIKLEQFYADARVRPAVPVTATPQPKKDMTALERLYAAQPRDLVERMVIPFDIAVYLSRMP